ncbi:MAG: hypothetical protein ACLQSR_17155 [Limisphaerales bacterium]
MKKTFLIIAAVALADAGCSSTGDNNMNSANQPASQQSPAPAPVPSAGPAPSPGTP